MLLLRRVASVGSARRRLGILAALLVCFLVFWPSITSSADSTITLNFKKVQSSMRAIELEIRPPLGQSRKRVEVTIYYSKTGEKGMVESFTRVVNRKGRVRFPDVPATDITVEVPENHVAVLVTGKDRQVALAAAACLSREGDGKPATENGVDCEAKEFSCPGHRSVSCFCVPGPSEKPIEGLPVTLVYETADGTDSKTRHTNSNGDAVFEGMADGEYLPSYRLSGRQVELEPLRIDGNTSGNTSENTSENASENVRKYEISVGRDPAAAFSPLGFSFDVGFQGSTFNENTPASDPNTPDGSGSEVFDDSNFFVGIFAEQNHGRRQQHQWQFTLQFGGINVEEDSSGPGGKEVIENAESVSFGLVYGRIVMRGRTSYVDSYVGGSVQVFSPTNESADERIDDDFLAEYSAHWGAMNANPNGLYRGSFVQIGLGQSDRFVDSDRWVVADGQILANFQRSRRYKLFSRFTFNSDLGRGADDFRITFGTRIALSERFLSLATVTTAGGSGQEASGEPAQPAELVN